MASSLRFASVILCIFACLLCTYALNNTDSTGTHEVTAVVLDNEAAFGVCVYPRSGTYSFLTRLLYYCTLVFSLFSRAHLWLVAGALTSALVYSGSAAVHACLLVWRGPNPFIESDSWALYAILNSACLVTVPLLNWSGTLRRLGQKAASIKDPKALKTNSEVGTRTIVIYWAFLITIGYICIWQQAHYGAGDNNMEYPDMNQVFCSPGTNASVLLSPNGTSHRRAIDSSFIQDNGCTDPCNQINNLPSIFRNQNELVLLPHSQALLWNFTLPGPKYGKAERLETIENHNLSINYWSLPFIILQGFITALFGRRDPREIRDLIYITLYLERDISHKPYLRNTHEILVRILAGFNYLIACAVVIFCVPFFIITLVSQEFQLWDEQPDSEKPYMVGQWSAWVYTALIIVAALIARYHDHVVGSVAKGFRSIAHSFSSYSSQRKRQDGDEPEHGAAEVNDDKESRIGSDNRSKSPTHRTSAELPSSDSSSHAPHNRATTTAALTAALHFFEACWHPLNQSGKGPIDELRNFFRWCRNPEAVSRLVIRHPIRVRDTKFIDAPPAVVDASKYDPRAKDERRSFFRVPSPELRRGEA